MGNDHADEQDDTTTHHSNTSPISDDVSEFDVAGTSDQESHSAPPELQAMQSAYAALRLLDEDAKARSVRWLIEVFRVPPHTASRPPLIPSPAADGSALPSDGAGVQAPPNPREFMSRKKPGSQVERVACLAYYLTKYRGATSFKTGEIVTLNMEAAAPRFGNPSRAVDHADRQSGYVVSAGHGAKQLTTRGEALVDALPDRQAVDTALSENPYRGRRSSNVGSRKSRPTEGDEG
ncbi:hypothetical protein [Streptomyces klenkii]|uniref:hypothetical protein n=1 Tax=Streptomyces klenkii TaxID=1420899 RepID=UPI00343F1E57